MIATSEKEFITKVANLLKVGKVQSPLYFQIGKTLGLTCKEIVDLKNKHFPKQNKNQSHMKGCLPDHGHHIRSDHKSIMSTTDLYCYENVVTEDKPIQDGVVVNTEDAFVWIASPDEISDRSCLHKTNY